MERRVPICMAAVLLILAGGVGWYVPCLAQGPALVLEDFQAKEADGFPSLWDHENQRSQSKGREAYKVRSENGTKRSYLSS